MIDFTRILCPVDFSDTSILALKYASAIARWYEATLEVLHVVPGQDAEMPPSQAGAGVLPTLERLVHAAGASDVAPQVLLTEGRAHERIAERAREPLADLVVMGTHGRTGFNRLLLGSVVEKVLRSVACPVLTVPPAVPGAPGRRQGDGASCAGVSRACGVF